MPNPLHLSREPCLISLLPHHSLAWSLSRLIRLSSHHTLALSLSFLITLLPHHSLASSLSCLITLASSLSCLITLFPHHSFYLTHHYKLITAHSCIQTHTLDTLTQKRTRKHRWSDIRVRGLDIERHTHRIVRIGQS